MPQTENVEEIQTDEDGNKFVVLTPNYANVTRDFARKLAYHSFNEGLGPVISFIEMVRYLQATDPEELEKIRQELLLLPQ